MKIVSWNVNGIRSVSQKGFFEWLNEFEPDILGIQEIKAQKDQIPNSLLASSYHLYSNPAQRKGYSGVAVYSKIKPKNIETKIGYEQFDNEGRFLKLDFDNFSIINVYIPNGGRDQSQMEYKLYFYDFFIKYLKKLKNEKIVLMGDFNIAHEEIDLARPKENEKNVMFTLPEREKISKLIEAGYIDTFRHLNKKSQEYSWWAYYRNLRERNIGWRIDYVFISAPLESKLEEAFIFKKVTGSDHCPVGIKLD
ncbi:exodeoxyribonuclease III [Patescibacteria group bacterium]|nr:exodeoxyribonuclease III [Patescibacteria group bacterium]